MLSLYTFLLLIVLPIRAFAILGDYLDPSLLPEQSCQIIIFNQKTRQKEGRCSGVLVAQDQILTASHCIIPADPYRYIVFCGKDKKIRRISREAKTHPQSRSVQTQDETQFDSHDVAVLTFSPPIRDIAPIRLPRNRAEFYSILKRNQCSIFGYGEDLEDRTGIHHGTVPEFFTDEEKHPTSEAGMLAFFGDNLIAPGDSGGGLFCRDSQGEWVTMGIHSHTSLGSVGESTSTYENMDWIAKQISPSYPTSEQLARRVVERCQDIEACKGWIETAALSLSQDVAAILARVDSRMQGLQDTELATMVDTLGEIYESCKEEREKVLDKGRPPLIFAF